MVSSKSSSPTTPKNFLSNGSAALKQGTLPFLSTKRTASRGKQPVVSRTPSGAGIQKPVDDSSGSSDESSEVEEVELPILKNKRRKLAVKVVVPPMRGGVEETEVAEREDLDLQDRKGRWRKHYGAVREKMGNIPPIHAQGQTKIHHILRVFDLSYEYGPCDGVTRLERWERAYALGLHPPPEVREILTTIQGTEESQFRECVFFEEEV